MTAMAERGDDPMNVHGEWGPRREGGQPREGSWLDAMPDVEVWGTDRFQEDPPWIAAFKITGPLHRGESIVSDPDGTFRLKSPLWRRLLHRTGAFERLPDAPEEPVYGRSHD